MIRPGGSATSFVIENAVTLLPQPVSPTSPTVSPRRMWKETPSSALTTPS
jgi:hypothetical protein